MGDDEAAEMVGIPVDYSFPIDCPSVQRSILAGGPVPSGSDLGESILALARSLSAHPALEASPTHWKFLDFFRVPPGQHPEPGPQH